MINQKYKKYKIFDKEEIREFAIQYFSDLIRLAYKNNPYKDYHEEDNIIRERLLKNKQILLFFGEKIKEDDLSYPKKNLKEYYKFDSFQLLDYCRDKNIHDNRMEYLINNLIYI